jgi:hypothetical protein
MQHAATQVPTDDLREDTLFAAVSMHHDFAADGEGSRPVCWPDTKDRIGHVEMDQEWGL